MDQIPHALWVTINGQTIRTTEVVVVRLFNEALQETPDQDVHATFTFSPDGLKVDKVENGEVVESVNVDYQEFDDEQAQ